MAGVEVKGTQEMMRQAQQGLQLLKAAETQSAEVDSAGAAAYKAEMELRIADLKQQAEQLTGKENKKARSEKSKEASALSNDHQYIDATRILKGLEPMHGFFVKAVAQPQNQEIIPEKPSVEPVKNADVIDAKTTAKKAGKPKKEESAGISKAERDELEKLKNSIIDLKKELKESGMTGGAINKDERVASMVARMNELKEKENPGSTATGKEKKGDEGKKKKLMSSEQEAEVGRLTKEIEEYRQMLLTEYKYSKKEIAADPDMVDKLAALAKLTGKK